MALESWTVARVFSTSYYAVKTLFILYSLFFYFARKTLKDIYKHTYSVIHKIYTFTVNKIIESMLDFNNLFLKMIARVQE